MCTGFLQCYHKEQNETKKGDREVKNEKVRKKWGKIKGKKRGENIGEKIFKLSSGP